MKVVCDTNVFFSAIVFGGVLEDIFLAANQKQIQLYTSPEVLLELAGILKKKAGWNDFQISFTVSNLSKLCKLVYPEKKIAVIKKDDPDNRILECALESQADYIITGDKKHLLPLKKFKSIKIISPRQFLIQVLYKQND